jgi:hypothetical protein
MKPSLGSAIVGDEAVGVEVALGRVDVRQAEVLNAAHAALDVVRGAHVAVGVEVLLWLEQALPLLCTPQPELHWS